MRYKIFAYTAQGIRYEVNDITDDVEAYRKKIMRQTGSKEVFLEYVTIEHV